MDAYTLHNSDISYLEELLLADGQLQILPYAQLEKIPQNDISLFCVRHGFYCLPTQELVDFLKKEINPAETIEIGSGNGVLAKALGITATDNFMQEKPGIIAYYKKLNQALVPYGENVLRCTAKEAIKVFKPKTVLAAWFTHLYDPMEHWRGGNMMGADEKKIIDKARYIHIGNENTHRNKPILKYTHQEIKAKWLLSRSIYKDQNVIWIWG